MKWIFSLLFFSFSIIQSQNLPKGFTYVKNNVPNIQQELRYCTDNNFVGAPINGYDNNVLITTTPTAIALKKVQKELTDKGFSLKIYDAYRPQKAVNHFIRWAKRINDTLMKKQYYPKVNKRNLFKLGYIASKSGHSRGSTVDLTIVSLPNNKELDMGSPYDFFGIASHVTYNKLKPHQQNNRLLLQKIMNKHGFRSYKNEWWHFTLRNEPFPKTYFDFSVK